MRRLLINRPLICRFALTLPLLLSVAILALLASCGGDDGGSPSGGGEEALAQGQLDAAGGEIGDDTATLTVPAGALDEAADLALYEDSQPGPFAGLDARVLRLEGVPYALNQPLSLRFQHGLTVAKGDSLGVFLGEERQSYDGGEGVFWHPIAGRDSAGWCIATITRGALPQPGKSAAAVRVANAPDVAVTYLDDGHIRIVYRSSEVQSEPAGNLLLNFEGAFQAMESWGFQFGFDTGYWPRDVVLCEPPGSWACFIPGPAGRGHFEIDPEFVVPGGNLLPVALHEFFHLVQTFYDTRDTSQWGTLNQERLWLDEATAAWLEATSVDHEDYYPVGLDGDNMTALLYGFNGTDTLENDAYGYGMSNFVHYWMEDPVNGQDEDHLVHMFEHFKEHGDATDALESVWNPDPRSWCVDMQRKLMAMKLYPYDRDGVVWWAWPWDGFLDSGMGSEQGKTEPVPDLGAFLCKFTITGSEPEDLTALKIRAVQDDAAQPAEHLPLAVYGRPESADIELLATGTDSLTVADWPALYERYQDIMILASRPFITAPGLEGSRDIRVSAEVVFDGSSLDLSSYNRVNIEVRTDNLFSNASGVFWNDIISVQADVAWTGGGYFATTADDTFTIPLDEGTMSVGPWYAVQRGTTIGGNYFVRRLGGTGVPFDHLDGESAIFVYRGEDACARLTHVFESMAADEHTAPFSTLLSYSCHDGGAIYDMSSVYMHFYHSD